MAASTFSALPMEIQVSIAGYCDNHSLINLCLTSKTVNARCSSVLYRHVNLNLRDLLNLNYGLALEDWSPENSQTLEGQVRRQQSQQQLVHTLLSHPEYGKYVRSFKGMLCPPSSEGWYSGVVSEQELWRALQLLTHVQSVHMASDDNYDPGLIVPTEQFPTALFQSATSVSLVGYMPYGLAKAMLNAINPATLKHLCLDFVQDVKITKRTVRRYQNIPGDMDGDGRILALGATTGLLTPLTGRCTALRTLVLRRLGQSEDHQHSWWHMASEEASYSEWAAFIRSVRGTVESFTFEQAGETEFHRQRDSNFADEPRPTHHRPRAMDDRFRHLLLPAIIASGPWPCLSAIELLGARGSNGQKATLATELRAVLGANVTIEVKEMVVEATARITGTQ